MLVCSQCGQENTAGARFCNACAAPLAQVAAETRKTVTVVFCDLVGSTSLGERKDPEVLRALMGRYHAELRRVLEAHGGTVEKFVGDAAMAVFGIPQVHEDDALRAVCAAVAMRESVRALGLEVRIGINTGEVVTGFGETLVTGDAVNVAARLEQAAASDEILVGETTELLVRAHVVAEPVDPLTLKGKAEPVPAFRVLNVSAQRAVDGAVTPFVGRETELEMLDHAIRTATDKRVPQLVTVIGAPGIGKSRLLAEALSRIDGRILVGRCLSYGDAITYWPLVDILESVGDLEDALGGSEDAAGITVRLAAAVGTPGAAASPDEIAWAFRRLVESLARDQLGVVVFDDIHWAEPTLLELIEYVATFSQDVPVVLLCTARPDLFDARPDWATPRANASLVRLEPLELSQVDSLVNLLGDVPDDVRERIVDAADGNPLFVEQLVAMHQESPNAELVIPPNLQALLAARIDRLETDDRLVIERASVEGRLFHRGAVIELLPERNRRDVGSRLMALVRRELVRPDQPTIRGDDGFRFGHILIRDAAYESVPKRVRAELHEKYADWLLARLGDDAPAEIVGYHLEQAYGYNVELGGRADALGDRAAAFLAQAGAAARLRNDVAAAIKFYDRAASMTTEPKSRARLLLAVAAARQDRGEFASASEALDEVQRITAQSGDQQAALLMRVARAEVQIFVEPQGATDSAIAEAESVIESAPPDDHVLLARAWQLIAFANNVKGVFSETTRALDHAMEHARAAGERQLEIDLVSYLAAAIVYGPMPVDEGFRKVDEMVGRLGDVPSVQALALHVLGHLRARHGDFGGADFAVRTWREHIRELGHEPLYAGTAQCAWDILSLAGDYAAGEQVLREGDEIFQRLGEKADRAGHVAYLAEAAYLQGRLDQAEELALLSSQLGAPDDAMTAALWRCALAKVRASRAASEDAVELAREGVENANRTDMLDLQAGCYSDLAQVLNLSGHHAEAREAAATATELYRKKGNEVGASRIEQFLSSAVAAD